MSVKTPIYIKKKNASITFRINEDIVKKLRSMNLNVSEMIRNYLEKLTKVKD